MISFKSPRQRFCSPRILAHGIGIAVLSLVGELHAQNIWTAGSATDFNWDTTANWSLGAKPLATDDVTFPTPIPLAGATITLGASELANSLTINDAYTLAGGDLTLTAGSIAVPTGITASIGSVLKGTAGITKTGNGILTLSGTNTYTGGTVIAANGGTLQITTALAALQGATTVNSGGTLHFNVTSAGDITAANNISGAGTVRVTAPGATTRTLSLTGDLSGFTGTIDSFPATGGGGKLRFFFASQAAVPSASATIRAQNGGTIYIPNAFTYGSSFQLFGGTTGEAIGQLRLEASGTVSGSVTLMADSTIGANSGTGTISGPIGESGGSFGFTKQGGGTIVLSNASNNYTGVTGIAAGTLSLTGGANRLPTGTTVSFTGNSTLNLNGNAQTVAGISVSPGVTGTLAGGTLTIGSGTISFPTNTAGTATLTGGAIAINAGFIDASAAGTTSGIFRNVTSAIVGSGGLTINAFGDTSDSGGGNTSLFGLNNANTFTGGVTITTGLVNAALDAAFGDAANPVTITGGGLVSSRGITLPATRSIILSGSGDRFFRVYGAQNATVNGPISGSGGLRKTDGGTLILAGANTYAGTTTVGGGTLLLATQSSLYNNIPSNWTDTNIVVNSGTTLALRVGGVNEFTASDVLTLSGLGTATGGFKNGAILGFDTTNAPGGTFTYPSPIANPGGNVLSVGKLGAKSLTLAGANTYTGTTTINRGTLAVTGSVNGTSGTPLTFTGTGTFNANEAAGVAQGMGTLTFSAGDGTVQSTYGGSGSTSLTFSSLATRAVGATENFVTSGGANGTTNSIVLTGVTANSFINQGAFFGGNAYAWNDAGGFVRGISYAGTPDTGTTQITASTVTTTGTHVQVTGAGAITGQTTATFSTLNLDNANNFVLAASQTLTVDGILKTANAAGGTISGGTGIQASSGGDLVIRTAGVSDSLTISAPILNNTNSALTKSGPGTLTLSGASTYAGGTRVNAGTLNINPAAGPTATSGPLGTGPVNVGADATISFNTAALTSVFANTFSGAGTVNIVTTANNGFALTGGNWGSFNGTINVNTTSGGKLSAAGVTFGSDTIVNVANGATFFTNGGLYTNAFTVNGPGNNENRGALRLEGGANIAGPVTLLGNATIGSGATGIISGVISGPFGISTAATSAGAVILAGANTYTGNTNITTTGTGAVMLRLGNSGVIPDGPGKGDVSLAGTGTGTKTLDLNTFSESINGLSGDGIVDTITGGTPTLTVGNNNATSTFSGVIKNTAGSLSLTKIGTGTLALGGANTYTGTTTVSDGTLQVNGTIAGTVQVNGGTLGGTSGSVGATTVNSGGAIAPGASIGTLNTGALTLNGNAQFKLEIDSSTTGTDLANVAGNLTLDSGNTVTLALSDLGSNVPIAFATTLTFIDYSGTWNGGTFAGLPDDSVFTFGVNQFQISYNGVSGSDTAVTLTVVPEPAAIPSLLGGIAVLLGLQRRRR
jgi:autotransporter-associated beta strand protein